LVSGYEKLSSLFTAKNMSGGAACGGVAA